MLALIQISTNQIIGTVAPGGWFTLPGNVLVSPSEDGWTDGAFRLAEIAEAAPVPPYKRVVNTAPQIVGSQAQFVHQLEDIPLADIKSGMIAALGARRWEKETAGLVIGGTTVATDRESRDLIHGAFTRATRNPNAEIRFKAMSGWITLGAAEMISVGDAVFDYVQACFDRECQLAAAIESAADLSALSQIDLNVGWP